jgi:predicted nucleic acid-binding protein
VKRYVLDSWALLAWLEGEAPADAEVQSLMDAAATGRVELWMSLMNLGEVFYATARKSGIEKAREDRKALLRAPIRFAGIDDELVWEAAELKATHVVAYADAFAAALTVRLKATLLTGDPEFDSLAEQGVLEVKRLARKGRRRG